MNIVRTLLIVALALLAGCGFQLRGHSPLPFAAAYIEAPRSSQMLAPLRHVLEVQGKTLLDRPEGAEARIVLSDEGMGKEILALSGDGKVREYRLFYRLTLSVLNAAGDKALPTARLLATRDYSYSDTQVLAKEGEETVLRQDMEREVLQQVLRRLAFVKP